MLLIDDSYNANQTSMQAAIDVLADQPGHTVLVLGAMGELGEDSKGIHEQIGAYAKLKGIDTLLTLVDQGDVKYLNDMAAYLKGFGENSAAYSDTGSLVARIKLQSVPLAILVKGSRLSRMERVVDKLQNSGALSC
jgi:UDP-N-acetylmuramyl pentapeptide synthase